MTNETKNGHTGQKWQIGQKWQQSKIGILKLSNLCFLGFLSLYKKHQGAAFFYKDEDQTQLKVELPYFFDMKDKIWKYGK